MAELIIVGAGVGGLSAALTAYEAGVRDIVVLEKYDKPGGNGAVAPVFPVAPGDDGVLTVDCQDDNRIVPGDPRISPDKRTRMDANFNAAMEWTHWAGDARLVRDLVKKAEETSDWFKSKMDGFVIPDGERGATSQLLLMDCGRKGINILCGRRAKKLVKSGNRVTGVVCDGPDGEERWDGKAVIVSTGGFFGNKKLLEKYFPYYDEDMFEDMHFMGVLQEGDGVEMAFEAGGESDGTVVFEWSVADLAPTTWLINNDINPEVLWVNSRGERFGNEEKIALRNSVFRQPHKCYYVIHDENAKYRMMHKDYEDLPYMGKKFYNYYGGMEKMYEKTDEITQRRIREGTMKICGTLEEAA